VNRTSPVDVVHNQDARRFEAHVEGLLCRADYRLTGGTMMLVHTGVPAALEGRGIAGQLVRAAFEHAADRGLKVVPGCSYVQEWARRNTDMQGVLAPGWEA
jgi:predicted GNAT family acetyltransferase